MSIKNGIAFQINYVHSEIMYYSRFYFPIPYFNYRVCGLLPRLTGLDLIVYL